MIASRYAGADYYYYYYYYYDDDDNNNETCVEHFFRIFKPSDVPPAYHYLNLRTLANTIPNIIPDPNPKLISFNMFL